MPIEESPRDVLAALLAAEERQAKELLSRFAGASAGCSPLAVWSAAEGMALAAMERMERVGPPVATSKVTAALKAHFIAMLMTRPADGG